MKFKKLAAVILTLLMCLMMFPANVSAASEKGIKLSKTSLSLTVGNTYTLKRTVTGFKTATVVWQSSDSSIASVSKGKVTAKKAGSAVISATIKGTKYKAVCKVTVKKKSSSAAAKTTTAKTETKTETKKTASSNNYSAGNELLGKMTVGWNLGNTLDPSNCTWLTNDLDYETAWQKVKTTKSIIDTVKKAGFNTVRIPVSWGNHMDKDGNINKAWLDRVQEVVDYAYDNGMYVILNTHHDLSWIKLTENDKKTVSAKFGNVWKQIAERFKDYDEKLIFEGMNEPRTEGSAAEWTGGTANERKVLNDLYKVFVDTVRSTGGNNKTRFLILTPYGANSGYAPMSDLELPDDDRIIVSVHAYLPYNMALNRYSDETKLTDRGKWEIDNAFSNIDKVFLSKGIPVIMDEFGSLNKDNTSDRVELVKYYLSTAEKYGVPCCWWDNNTICPPSEGEGLGLLDRATLKWFYPEIVKAIMETVK